MRLGDDGAASARAVLSERQARRAAIVATLAGLFLTLYLGLIGALFAGLLVHELVHVLARPLSSARVASTRARALSVGVIAALVIGVLVAAGFGAAAFLRSEGGSPAALLARLADILASSRDSMPAWIADHLPADAEALREAIVDWLRSHASELQHAGRTFGLGLVHILIGMVIGAMILFREAHGAAEKSVLMREGAERMRTLAHAFRGVVFAQVKISAVNTVLTAIYLMAVLPLLGIHLPFTKAMVAVTFVAGLLPVVGNLISNTIIVIVSLSASFGVALGSVTFLLVVHKLEYFLNARIVGAEIKASSWELLCAMLAMDAAFGVPGLIAAPIFYAYGKAELRNLGLL